MILYFSSTGNCKYIAQKIASELGDLALSISQVNSVSLGAGEKLGLVFPTYFWRLPSIVTEYMQNLKIVADDKQPYIYFISTYGSTCGQTGKFMKRHLKAKGFKIDLYYSIKTVDDWTVWFDVNNRSEVDALLSAEQGQIQEVVGLIKGGVKGYKMKNTLPMIAVMGSNVFYSLARRTKHLHVLESCIGCGLCERECPTKAIQIKNGKPTWVKHQCAMCLHCLHACPQFAIQYGDKTKEHGQYMHPPFIDENAVE